MGRTGSEYFHWIGLELAEQGVDVATEFVARVRDRGEDAAGDAGTSRRHS
jgi:hypothetical protein